jgi:hypothetical protein
MKDLPTKLSSKRKQALLGHSTLSKPEESKAFQQAKVSAKSRDIKKSNDMAPLKGNITKVKMPESKISVANVRFLVLIS